MNTLPQNVWDRRLAAPMFFVTVAFLALVSAAAEWMRLQYERPPTILLGLLAATYAMFWLEFLFHRFRRDSHCRSRVWCCLFPPLRLCGRDYDAPRRRWAPLRGWVETDRRLVADLERVFSLPMILIALMILPLLAIEQYWESAIAENAALRLFVGLATCVIWLAFTLEFFVMIAVAEKKLDYCKRHWMDIVVICLPFVAFLRFLRLGQAMRLQQLAKLGKAYRMRGVTMRLWRSILLLDLIARVVRVHPEKQLAKLREMIEDKEHELTQLRARVCELEEEIAVSKQSKLSLSEAAE